MGYATGKSDLQMLYDLIFEYSKNLLCGYLIINSLRNKIDDLREIMHVNTISSDYFLIRETKLNGSFPNAQLTMSNYEIRAKKDREKYGGGLIEFVRKNLIWKRLRKSESLNIEMICSEVTISNKSLFTFSLYRRPDYSNLMVFFKELGKYLKPCFWKLL